MTRLLLQLLGVISWLLVSIHAFSTLQQSTSIRTSSHSISRSSSSWIITPPPSALFAQPEQEDEDAIIEQVRLDVLKNRRQLIRTTLKVAEGVKNTRLKNGWVQDNGKIALSLTAFVVAGGAVALRVGGRAALVSAVGLDGLLTPELQSQMTQILHTADAMDFGVKLVVFTACWTATKVLLLDAAGVALALSAGILFGGVWQGALASAGAATIGSTVAFGLAKLETPLRRKALELLEENPSLRGVEKVVAKDGLKAILTLRLAPVLPIPIGAYNYLYACTNVPLPAFMGGIFLGSLKPYLLDSYLGIFGKSLLEGNTESGWEDTLLLVALGVSVLIGVFASQLATETWESVLEEVEAESDDVEVDETSDGIVRNVLGVALPEWLVGFQIALKQADERMNAMVTEEYMAGVWNATKEAPPPSDRDPAYYPDAPEIRLANQGIDFGTDLCNGLVLSPILFGSFLKYSDPLYEEKQSADTDSEIQRQKKRLEKRLDATQALAAERLALLETRLNS